MRPLEVIHSVERIAAAKEIQHQTSSDPYKVGGELNLQQTEEKTQLEQTVVIASNKKETIDTDEKNENKNKKNKSSKKNKETDDENNALQTPKEPDKGNFLDINA